IVINVASNGLTSLLVKSGHHLEKLIVGEKFLEKQRREKSAIQPLLQKAITDVAVNASWDAPKGAEIVSLFLNTPEVEEIVRQIYSTGYVEEQRKLSSVRNIFFALLTQYFSAYPSDFLPKADQLA